MRKLKILFVIFLAVLIFVPSVWASETVPGDVLVVFKAEPGMTVTRESLEEGGDDFIRVTSIAEDLDARVVEIYPALSKLKNVVFALLHSDVKSEDVLIEELLALPDVLSASPNYISSSMSAWYEPDDPYYWTENNNYHYMQWGLRAVRAPEAWKITSGDPGVYVAVIDSGIDFTHVDLINNFDYASSNNFYAEDYAQAIFLDIAHDFLDYNGHGTHVAGIISAQGNNGTGVTGVSWNSKLLALRVGGKDGKTNDLRFLDESITQALEYIAEMIERPKFTDKTLIVNISMGRYESKTPEKMQKDNDPQWLALSALSGTDRVLFCVSAGNQNIDIGLPAPEDSDEFKKGQYHYPAAYRGIDNMIVVANARYRDNDSGKHYVRNGAANPNLYSGSNYSTEYVHIAAPGTEIWSTLSRQHNVSYDSDPISHDENGNYYVKIDGTSMAAPFVAGAAALLLSEYPDATASRLRDAICKGANTYYAKDYTKYGFLNIDGAFKYMRGESVPVGVPVDDFNFPDDNFRAYVSENIDTDGNGYLNSQEIEAVTSINASGRHIAALTGIEIFEALRTLDVSNNDFTDFIFAGGASRAITEKSNPYLSEINLSDCASLDHIEGWGKENLETINLERCRALTDVYLEYNKNLKTLKLDGCPSITNLTCKNGVITDLDVSGFSALFSLKCNDNKISTLDLSNCPLLAVLDCSENNITSLDLSGCPLLEDLNCSKNSIAALDLSACPLLIRNMLTLNLSSQDCYGMTVQKKSEGLYTIDFNDFIPKKTSILTESIHVYNQGGRELVNTSLNYDSQTGILTVSKDVNNLFKMEPAKISYKYITSNKIPPYVGNDTPFFMDVIMNEGIYYTPDTDSGDININPIVIKPVALDDFDFEFRELLELYDSDWDGRLSASEIAKITSLTIEAKESVYNNYDYIFPRLIGIEHLKALQKLEIIAHGERVYSNVMADELDLSECSSLTYLSCSGGYVNKINLNGCEALTTLELSGNSGLSELNLNGCTALKTVNFLGNKCSSLDIDLSENKALTTLNCSYHSTGDYYDYYDYRGSHWTVNKGLTGLNVKGCTNLTSLKASGNKELSKLEINGCSALKELYCNSCSLKTLDLSGCSALEGIDCANNDISKLDVTVCKGLRILECESNDLTVLNTTNHTQLVRLNCSENKISELNVQKCNALQEINFDHNRLAYIDLENNTALTVINGENILSAKYNLNLIGSQTIYTAEFSEADGEYAYKTDIIGSRVPADKLVNIFDIWHGRRGVYDKDTGVLYFENELPNEINYEYGCYKINGKNYYMYVTVDVSKKAMPARFSTKTLPDGRVYENYDSYDSSVFKYDSSIYASGTAPLTFTMINNDLPEDLECKIYNKADDYYSYCKISSNNNYLYHYGVFHVTLKVENSAGSDTKTFAVCVNGIKPEIGDASLENSEFKETYSQWLGAYGTPMKWTAKGLPPGLSLHNSEPDSDIKKRWHSVLISGTPKKIGEYNVEITASNDYGFDTKTYKISISESSKRPVINTDDKPDNAVFGEYYTFDFRAWGYTATWTTDSKLPKGLELDKYGNLKGTPKETGKFPLIITASNDFGIDTKTFELVVEENEYRPVIYNEKPYSAVVGEYYTFDFYASGYNSTWATDSRLPEGLKLDEYTGRLSGTPKEAGKFTIKITATNIVGVDTKIFELVVRTTAKQILITTDELDVAKIGEHYEFQLYALNSEGAVWTAKTKLPPDLNLDENGLLSGVPTKAKNYTFTVEANNGDEPDTKILTLLVVNPVEITTASLKEGTVGKNYNAKLKANGSKPIKWSMPTLPKGLNFNTDNGIISGVPEVLGTFPLIITAENAGGFVTVSMDLKIHAVAPKISGKFAAGFLSEPYSSTITLSKGTEPIEWTLEGDLPEGLSFDKKTATLSGTPAQTWNGSLVVTASNDAGVAQKAMSLKIKGTSPKVSGKFEKGNLNELYSSALTLSKGTLPVKFSFEGTLPNGLNFNPETLTLSGIPTELWNDYITVTVTNGAGSYSKAFKIQIKGTAPKILTSGLPVGTVNENYDFELEATGSNPITWTAENLPNGLSLNDNRIEGTPSEECRNLKIAVRASNPVKTVSKTFRLTVNEAVVEETSSPAPSEKFENNSEEISDKSEEIKPEENISEEKIIFGAERDASSVNMTVISEDYEIAAVLPEIHVTESGMYEINVELDENIEAGRELIWLACAKNSEPSDDDKIAEFYDEEGNEITEVTENHKITVSAWFNEGIIYEPVVAVKIK